MFACTRFNVFNARHRLSIFTDRVLELEESRIVFTCNNALVPLFERTVRMRHITDMFQKTNPAKSFF